MESMTLNRTPTDVIADRLTPSGYSPLVHVGERCSLSSLYVDSLDRGQCSAILLNILDCCLVSVHATFPSVNPHLRENHQPESRMRYVAPTFMWRPAHSINHYHQFWELNAT